MTFLSYGLPEGAPIRIVWFIQCDKCFDFDTQPRRHSRPQRETVEALGWRYESSGDTCAACLQEETQR